MRWSLRPQKGDLVLAPGVDKLPAHLPLVEPGVVRTGDYAGLRTCANLRIATASGLSTR